VVASVINAVAAGVFLYVAVLGILLEELRAPEHLWAKIVVLVAGVALTGCLAFTG
jgi:hypothetical protein